jgi:hypothetical protein
MYTSTWVLFLPVTGHPAGPMTCGYVVGGEGFEPSTSSTSRKRSPPELTARRVQPLYADALDPTARAASTAAMDAPDGAP